MELKKDLLEKKEKSIFSIIYSIVVLLFILILWIANTTNQLRWVYVVFIPSAILNLTNGFGIHFESLFGKAFVEIDEDSISIKLGIREKEQTVFWKDIKTVEHKLNKLQIHTIDNKIQTIDLSKSNFKLKNEIREVINSIANEKKIKIIDLQ